MVSNDDIDHDLGSDIVTFFINGMSFATIDLNKINLDNDNFDEDDPANIYLVRFFAWSNRFKQRKGCKNRINYK